MTTPYYTPSAELGNLSPDERWLWDSQRAGWAAYLTTQATGSERPQMHYSVDQLAAIYADAAVRYVRRHPDGWRQYKRPQ